MKYQNKDGILTEEYLLPKYLLQIYDKKKLNSVGGMRGWDTSLIKEIELMEVNISIAEINEKVEMRLFYIDYFETDTPEYSDYNSSFGFSL